MPNKERSRKSRLLPYLLLAVLVTSLFSTGTLAKYKSMFSGSVEMQVAAFAGGGKADFAVTLDEMVPGSTNTMQFTVQNFDGEQGCDVALEYEIQIETTGNLPLTFGLIGINDNESASSLVGGLDSTLKATGGKLPFVSGTENKTAHKYELNITWPEGETDEDYSNEIDMVSVTVTTVQAKPEEEN